jgi:hypothetical protein
MRDGAVLAGAPALSAHSRSLSPGEHPSNGGGSGARASGLLIQPVHEHEQESSSGLREQPTPRGTRHARGHPTAVGESLDHVSGDRHRCKAVGDRQIEAVWRQPGHPAPRELSTPPIDQVLEFRQACLNSRPSRDARWPWPRDSRTSRSPGRRREQSRACSASAAPAPPRWAGQATGALRRLCNPWI